MHISGIVRYSFVSRTLAFLLLVLSAIPASASEQPNFVVIAIDDLKRVIGILGDEPDSFLSRVYPDPVVRNKVRAVLSPNMDRLAQRSLLFTNAHAAAPVCNASRVALMTGSRPDRSRITANQQIFRKERGGQDLITMPQGLKDNGYFTSGLGKVFHRPLVSLTSSNRIGSDYPDSQYSWTQWVNRNAGSARVYDKSIYSRRSNMNINFGISRLGLEDEFDIINAQFLADLIRDGSSTIYDESYDKDVTVELPDDAPFYLSLGILLPHEPFIAPADIMALFDDDDIQVNRAVLDTFLEDVTDLSQGGKGFATTNLRTGKLGGDFQKILKLGNAVHGSINDGDITAWKSVIKHYLASVAVADRGVGLVLDALEASEYADNTVVVIHSDHGYHLGEKNRLGKNTLFDEATGSVLIVHKPGQVPGVVRNNVSLMDIYPTVMSLAGVEPPDYIDGNDLSVFFDDNNAYQSAPSLTVHGSAANRHSIRTNHYRYMRFKNNTNNAELYNTANDPFSLNNLIDDVEYDYLQLALDQLMDNTLSADATPPVMALPPALSSPVSSDISVSVEAWQAQGESLSFAASGLPVGVSINPATGLLSGFASVTGAYDVTLTVSSDSGSVSQGVAWLVDGTDTVGPVWSDAMASATVSADNTVDISWNNGDEFDESVYYLIQINDLPPLISETTSIEVDGLVANTAYTAVVQAVDNSGNASVNGPQVSFVIAASGGDTAPPFWSENGVIRSLTASTDSLRILWTGAKDDVGVVSYKVSVTDIAGMARSMVTLKPIALIEDLSPDTRYYIRVEATDLAGNVSTKALTAVFSTKAENVIRGNDAFSVLVDGKPLEFSSVSGYGKQDRGGTAELNLATNGVTLQGNTWKYVVIDADITRDTILRFDFSSDVQGGVHGVALETNLFASSSKTFKVFGTRRFGVTTAADAYQPNSGTVSYELPIGQYIIGKHKYLVFVNDHDVDKSLAQSTISNIVIE